MYGLYSGGQNSIGTIMLATKKPAKKHFKTILPLLVELYWLLFPKWKKIGTFQFPSNISVKILKSEDLQSKSNINFFALWNLQLKGWVWSQEKFYPSVNSQRWGGRGGMEGREEIDYQGRPPVKNSCCGKAIFLVSDWLNKFVPWESQLAKLKEQIDRWMPLPPEYRSCQIN